MARAAAMVWMVVFAAGCATDWTRFDAEVSKMIQQRQDAALRDEQTRDPAPNPPITTDTRHGDRPYDKQPVTVNPAPDELPATAAGEQRQDLDRLFNPPTAGDESRSIRSMDLDQALAYAIEHSREYSNRKEELFLAALNLLIQEHLFSPRFFNTTTVQFAGTPESGDYDHALRLINELGVTQKLPYGGSLTASALVNFTHLLRTAADSTAEDSQSAAVALSGTLPLLRGAGLTAREDLIQAQRDLIYAARDFENFRRQFLVTVATAYFDLLQQQEAMKNKRGQIASLELLARRFAALADAGREPYFEVERSQQQVLFARNDLLNTQEQYAAAVDAFKIRIGMDTLEQLVIVPSTIVVPPPALDMESAVSTAEEYRLDLQTSRDRVDDARRRVNVARNAMLPDLDLFGRVTVPTRSDERYGGLKFDAGEGSYTAGVTFDAPLDRRIEHIRARQATINLERAGRAFTLLRDQIALEVRRSVRQIEQARFTLDLQVQNVKLAQRRVAGVRLRERSLGPRDVIEALNDLVEAQNRRDAAERNLRVSVLEYLLATGQMRVSPQGRWVPPVSLVARAQAEESQEPILKDSVEVDSGAEAGGQPHQP